MNQDNFNINKESNEIVNSNQNNNPEILNVIPGGTTQNTDNHQYDNAFLNGGNQTNEIEEVNKYLNKQPNRFIQDDIDTTTNNLNDLNVEHESLSLPKVDYSKDPKVIENMNKKNTVSISSEGKIFLIIILVLLLFIFVLPTIFDYIRDIQYH